MVVILVILKLTEMSSCNVKKGWRVAVSLDVVLYTADRSIPANMSAIGLLEKFACKTSSMLYCFLY